MVVFKLNKNSFNVPNGLNDHFINYAGSFTIQTNRSESVSICNKEKYIINCFIGLENHFRYKKESSGVPKWSKNINMIQLFLPLLTKLVFN
ncbi:hypothetical protein H5410_051276 [Solanum commersonii]|uniref:Uncharacterized protein n=1 Tax=Solanum commersonii TaxID=4109 RepID=A0A9J5WXR3_SOLCO|nr:hypothetical protein H5410_051276 [Solanum commersonii]